MTNRDVKILTLQEYGDFITLEMASMILGVSTTQFWRLLTKSLAIITPKKGESHIERSGLESFRFVGIAGILALKRNVRIEIIPKFLNKDSKTWRDDFLTISLISNYGHLLPDIPIPSAPKRGLDLYELIADTWINLFESNNRLLIRTYVTSEWSSFLLDGEAEEENLIISSDSGFLQKGLRLSSANSENKILTSAAKLLLGRISNPIRIRRLEKAFNMLSYAVREQGTNSPRTAGLKRKSPWSGLLELSKIILDYNTVGLSDTGRAYLPGYILRTNYAWETLVFKGTRKAFSHLDVSKRRYQIGAKVDKEGNAGVFKVVPDVSIRENEKVKLIVDAKYKRAEFNVGRKSIVSKSDVYEGLAFMLASKCDTLILLYPQDDLVSELQMEPFEVYTIDQHSIYGHSIGVNGISKKGGFKEFSLRIETVLAQYLIPKF